MLTEHIAVMDLLALADALLLPDDDLALATVLKSPLFGLTEDELVRAGVGSREGTPAHGALRSGSRNARLDAIAREASGSRRSRSTRLCRWRRHGRQRFLARLGLEANDVLDEFLNLALDL